MRNLPSVLRLIAAVVAGLLVMAVTWRLEGWPSIVLGWVTTVAVYVMGVWVAILPMDESATRQHATREDPGRLLSTVVLLVASVASLAGVAVLLRATSAGGREVLNAAIGTASVVASWVMVHTLFTLHYARLYYAEAEEPVDFNGDAPDYQDFAYLAFTLGMTYQVSDTALRRPVRRAVLRHALLAFLLGAIVLACTVNLVVQLASTG